jgi:hypothetical protein
VLEYSRLQSLFLLLPRNMRAKIVEIISLGQQLTFPQQYGPN